MIDFKELEGKWYIVKSNFPMWLKGDKTSPTFNYTISKKGKEDILLDKVEYFKNGKIKSIDGFDKSLNSDNTKFVWRGNGILILLKSNWEILYRDNKNEWAVIEFEKTLFTPHGYDVISRKKSLSPEEEQSVRNKLDELGIKDKLSPILQK